MLERLWAERDKTWIDSFSPFPSIDNREWWNDIPSDAAEQVLLSAKDYRGWLWPSLPAVVYMDFARNGNRSRYQSGYSRRRQALNALVLAECLENQGLYLDDIMNGIWCICEESSWVIPAHNNMHPDQAHIDGGRLPLPNVSLPVVDLFAAETASTLAWVHYLLQSRLNAVTPLMTERIRLEVKKRILDPYLSYDTFWWMGLDQKEHHLNNWNPWINSNVLAAFLLLENDPGRKQQGITKVVRSLSRFLDQYPEDGGCDEGPGYWNRAGGSVHDCLELLLHAGGGSLNAYDQPLIREMGRYISRVHIHDRWYVNFADCSAKVDVHPSRVYRYGQRIGDENMMALGLQSFHKKRENGAVPGQDLYHGLLNLFSFQELSTAEVKSTTPLDVWLPNVEIMTARESERTAEGIFIAVKGGHNAESHNHNDIGQVIVYADGEPVLIDAGVGTYTAETFGSDRYSIWTMQSAYHNLPTVNGILQSAGRTFSSTGAVYLQNEVRSELSLDMASAYPAEAGILEWRRTIRLNRQPEAYVEIVDNPRLKQESGITFHWLTAVKPERTGMDGFVIPLASGRCVLFSTEGSLTGIDIEAIEITDQRLGGVWGKSIFRISYTTKAPADSSAAWCWRMRIAQK